MSHCSSLESNLVNKLDVSEPDVEMAVDQMELVSTSVESGIVKSDRRHILVHFKVKIVKLAILRVVNGGNGTKKTFSGPKILSQNLRSFASFSGNLPFPPTSPLEEQETF